MALQQRQQGDGEPGYRFASQLFGLYPEWHKRALCLGSASRYFDPWDTPESMWEPPQDLVQICKRCPVRTKCLIDALKNNDHCVRAGTTRKQRDALKRPRFRDSCPVCEETLAALLPDERTQVCTSCGLTWRTPTT